MKNNNNVVTLGQARTTFSFDAYIAFAKKYGAPIKSARYTAVLENGDVLGKAIELRAHACLAMDTLRHGRVDDSLGSFIQQLASKKNITVRAAGIYPIKFCLMTNVGIKREDITHVIAHSKGLAACAENLKLLGVPTMTAPNNGEAARLVSSSHEHAHWAALGPASAAKEYGLVVLDHSFEDEESTTTFYFIGPEGSNVAVGKKNRALIAFELPKSNKKGTLRKSLEPFDDENLNLIQIYSMHVGNVRRKPIYDFVIELEVNREKIKNLKRAMKKFSVFIKRYKIHGPFKVSKI
jgi:prephenate dehydratase